jgi:hypothetical protein
MTALVVAYVAGSLFVLRVIWLEIVLAEQLRMSWYERTWRAAVSFALWPFLLGLAVLLAVRNFFWKGHWQ